MVAVVVFVVVIVASIMIHEAGHFATARWFGMKAERFFFGFGPTLWSVRRGETEYGVKAIPAGGFVKIAGMNRYEQIAEGDRPRAFFSKPAWQRAIVLAAGSVTHYVIAAVLLFVAMAAFPLPRLENGQLAMTNEIVEIEPGSPAEQAGLRTGDRIVAVDGTPTDDFTAVRNAVGPRAEQLTRLDVQRDGQTRTVEVQLGVSDDDGQRRGFLGVYPEMYQRWSPGEAFAGVWVGEYSLPTQVARSLAGIVQIFRPDSIAAWLQQADRDMPRTADGPVSLIGAGQAAAALSNIGQFSSVIVLLAQLQIVIGTLNLLPLPPFDGGHLAVLGVESVVNAVRRRRGATNEWQVDPASLMPLTLAVLLLFGLFALTALYIDTVNPISNLIQ